jgi:sterol 3beta-glucosyltransferase
MRVGITTMGTRGDIEPFAALAHALTTDGHEVLMSTPADAADLVTAAGATLVSMNVDMRSVLRSSDGQEWLASGDVRSRRLVPATGDVTASILAVAEGADVLISGINTDDYAIAVAQATGVRLVDCHLTPWLRTREFPNPIVSTVRLWPRAVATPVNLATHQRAQRMYWQGRRDGVNAFRASLGLGAAPASAVGWLPRLNLTVLHAYSTEVVPKPRDWGPRNLLTGYWRLPREARDRLGEAMGSSELTDWLADGPPPLFVGFGSMPVVDPAALVALVVAAADQAGVRVLIGAGWSELEDVSADLPPHARAVGGIDHDWLFPRCQAVVHHGGAGTTAAGLIAGCPTWVYSVFSDQPFWGSRMARLGVGGHGKFADLTADGLTAALRHLARDDVRARARALGARLRQENGLALAVRAVTQPEAMVPAS